MLQFCFPPGSSPTRKRSSALNERKNGKLHNAVGGMYPTQMYPNIPSPHTKEHSHQKHLNRLERVRAAQDYRDSQDFPPVLWRLGTPRAHQQQLPLRVLTAYCFPHRQIGLAPATPTAMVTYLCPEFTPGQLASHLQPKRQRLATARSCEHAVWCCLLSSSVSHTDRRKINCQPLLIEAWALQRLQNVALILPSPCSTIMHACLWKQLLSNILPLPRAENQINQKTQPVKFFRTSAHLKASFRLEVEHYPRPPNFLYFCLSMYINMLSLLSGKSSNTNFWLLASI